MAQSTPSDDDGRSDGGVKVITQQVIEHSKPAEPHIEG